MFDMEISKIDAIEYAKKMYDAQVKRVNEETYICNVLKVNYVNEVKFVITRYDLINDTFRKACGQVNEKLQKNKKEFEMIKSYLYEDFLDGNRSNAFKLKEIICCGYEGYAWSVKFEGYGKTFQITIPIKNNINTRNIESAYNGMFAFHVEEKEHIWTLMKKSYRIEDISNFIKEYFNLNKVNEDEC